MATLWQFYEILIELYSGSIVFGNGLCGSIVDLESYILNIDGFQGYGSGSLMVVFC